MTLTIFCKRLHVRRPEFAAWSGSGFSAAPSWFILSLSMHFGKMMAVRQIFTSHGPGLSAALWWGQMTKLSEFAASIMEFAASRARADSNDFLARGSLRNEKVAMHGIHCIVCSWPFCGSRLVHSLSCRWNSQCSGIIYITCTR